MKKLLEWQGYAVALCTICVMCIIVVSVDLNYGPAVMLGLVGCVLVSLLGALCIVMTAHYRDNL